MASGLAIPGFLARALRLDGVLHAVPNVLLLVAGTLALGAMARAGHAGWRAPGVAWAGGGALAAALVWLWGRTLAGRARRIRTQLSDCARGAARHVAIPPALQSDAAVVAFGLQRLGADLNAATTRIAALVARNQELFATGRRLTALSQAQEAALNHLPLGVLMLGADTRVVLCNRRFPEMFGLRAEIIRPGVILRTVLAHGVEAGAVPDDGQDPAGLEAILLRRLADGRGGRLRTTLADGRTIALRWVALRDGGWLCTCEDISDRRMSERRLAHMARHDALTDLPNRIAFQDALAAALARCNEGERLAVLCLDLDRFKQINDTLGHGAGDEVLREAARRLRAALREDDVLARLGSDEFAVLQSDTSQPEAAATLARRLIEVLAHPYAVGEQNVAASASVGIALVEPGEPDSDALVRRADLALYRAKQEGRSTWRFFDSAMDAAAQSRRALEMDLREAMNRDEFELYYQPLISVQDRRVAALEALIRWRHPTRGMIPPDRFIPLAEELGLIVPIGEWVLRTACATAVLWPASVQVAVNLSPVQFIQPGLLEVVQAALADTGLPAERLELEITESVLLADSKETLDVLHRLRAMGVRISMDDFGTGYSSLSYLRSFPFDKLKIDKSFISSLDESEESEVIVRAIAALGNSLGMATTAEGVETLGQLERLIADGCTEVQGYFFSPPRPASDIPRLLADGAARQASAA